jgi:hypothetical protein
MKKIVGEIEGFIGTWSSGLAQLLVRNGRGLHTINCENAATVRALDAAFGNVITSDHCVDVDAIRGRKVECVIDDFGLMAGFNVVDVD